VNGDRVSQILEKGKLYEQEKERKRKEREMAQDPELTFKPKINNTNKKAKKAVEDGDKAKPSPAQPAAPIWERLHSQAEDYWRMKFDRERDAIEWARQPDEYTFKPSIMGDRRAGKEEPLYFAKKPQIYDYRLT